MKDLEFYPVTLCSRWRSGQARPGRSQERRSERGREEMGTEGWDEVEWGGGLRDKAVVSSSCSFDFFFNFLSNSHKPAPLFPLLFSFPLFLSVCLWDLLRFSPPRHLTHFTHSHPLPSSSCPAEATPEPSHKGSRPQPTYRCQE